MKVEPFAVYLPVKRRKPNPHAGFSAMLSHAADHLQSGRITKLAGSADVQIARLDMKIALVLVEELLPIRAIGSFPDVL